MQGLHPEVRSDQLAGIPGTTIPRAVQACTACKKQKRKCDKLLPACSRCASLQRMCEYVESGPAAVPSAQDFAALQTKLAEIEARLNNNNSSTNYTNPGSAQILTPAGSTGTNVDGGGSSEPSPDNILTGNSWPPGYGPGPAVRNSFPGALFLDIDIYNYAGLVPPRPVVDVPMEVIEILDSSEVIEQTALVYFETTHKWFSFISRKRMNLGISLADGGPDLALLFLAMKLITTTPSPELYASAADMPLYRTTKQFTALLEAAGTTSILYLQAMILVTLYEYSHAVYPAAWMSVGSCVRYAAMLGLPSYGEASSVLGPCSTWTEVEERRRVWWATHILDRVISLGSKRPFAGGPDPPADAEALPVDDAAWDAGEMSHARPVGTSVEEPMGSPFTRLAQAAVLISKAMAHCKQYMSRTNNNANGNNGDDDGVDMNDPAPPPSLNIREVTALMTQQSAFCRTVGAEMAAAAAAEPGMGTGTGRCAYFGFLAARCLSWSANIMVLDLYSCPGDMRPGAVGAEHAGRGAAEHAMQVEAVSGLKIAGTMVKGVAVEVLDVLDRYGGEQEEDIRGVDRFSPLCLDTLYCGMSTFHWLWRENGDPEMKEGLDVTRQCLDRVGRRWRLAGEFLEIEKRHDVAAMLAASVGSNGVE